MIATLEQRKQGFNDSSVSDNTNAPNSNRLQCPSTPKEFKSFDSLNELQYNGNMLTPEERSELYKDHTKVILKMAEAYNVFSGAYTSTQRCQTDTRATLIGTLGTIRI